jgi:predicted DNA-binding transcriptional regulator AlpA
VDVAQLELMASGDIAKLLGITQQRVDQLSRTGKMPEPVATVSLGRIWLRSEIEAWARETGRLK